MFGLGLLSFFPYISFWITFFIKQLQFCIGQVYFLELKRLTTRGEYLRSAIDFVRNLILTISAWNYSKGPSKLNRAEDLDMFFLYSTTGVYKDTRPFRYFRYVFLLFYLPLASSLAESTKRFNLCFN